MSTKHTMGEEKESLAKQLHEWYLEACLKPESQFEFNPKVQEPYEALPEGSKFLDRYIAEKVLALLSHQREQVLDEVGELIKSIPISATGSDIELGKLRFREEVLLTLKNKDNE